MTSSRRGGGKLFRFRCAVYKASSPLLKIIYELVYIYIYIPAVERMAANSSCKRIPSRTTLSRESNRGMGGFEIDRTWNEFRKKGKRKRHSQIAEHFTKFLINREKIRIEPLCYTFIL